MESAFLSGEQRYDVIFCRNLLIYLDADARLAAFANLRRLLATDGVLYVGHVEGGTVRGERFESYDAAFPFAFWAVRGKMDVSVVPPPLRARRQVRRPSRWINSLPAEANRHPGCRSTSISRRHARLPIADAWMKPRSNVWHLLDEGPTRARMSIVCSESFGKRKVLLKSLRSAFHKALYLDPAHHESLVHLALLASQRGEQSAALNYRRRAEKRR